MWYDTVNIGSSRRQLPLAKSSDTAEVTARPVRQWVAHAAPEGIHGAVDQDHKRVGYSVDVMTSSGIPESTARRCPTRGDGRAGNGAPPINIPEVSEKRTAMGYRRRLQSSEGKSNLYRPRRKGRAVATERLPDITGRLEDDSYREQQRVAREEKVARRVQAIADNQARKDETKKNYYHMASLEVRGMVPLLPHSFFESTLVGKNPYPQPWRGANLAPRQKSAAGRVVVGCPLHAT